MNINVVISRIIFVLHLYLSFTRGNKNKMIEHMIMVLTSQKSLY